MEDGRWKRKALNTASDREGRVPAVYYPGERSGFLEGRGFRLFSCLLWGWGREDHAGRWPGRPGRRPSFPVAFVQFMKAGTSGEREVFDQISQVRYFCPGEHPFIMPRGPGRVHFRHAEAALQSARMPPEGIFLSSFVMKS